MKLLQRKIQDTRRPKENGKMDLLKRIHVHKDPKVRWIVGFIELERNREQNNQ